MSRILDALIYFNYKHIVTDIELRFCLLVFKFSNLFYFPFLVTLQRNNMRKEKSTNHLNVDWLIYNMKTNYSCVNRALHLQHTTLLNDFFTERFKRSFIYLSQPVTLNLKHVALILSDRLWYSVKFLYQTYYFIKLFIIWAILRNYCWMNLHN